MNEDSFFSMDRLVEFGLGMAVARQMTEVMNDSMRNMHVPGAMQPMHTTAVSQAIYVAIGGKSVGPLSQSEFMELVTRKEVTKESLVWLIGMSAWQAVENVPEILKLIALSPPPLNP